MIRTLARMEMNGVCLDSAMLKELSKTINTRLSELTERIYDYAGYQFNINSTQQLAKVLFEEKGLPAKKRPRAAFPRIAAYWKNWPSITRSPKTCWNTGC